jgi:hypothetical protein
LRKLRRLAFLPVAIARIDSGFDLSFAKTRSSVSEAQGWLDATADHGLVKLEQAMPATASGCRRDPGTNGPAFGERDRALFRS